MGNPSDRQTSLSFVSMRPKPSLQCQTTLSQSDTEVKLVLNKVRAKDFVLPQCRGNGHIQNCLVQGKLGVHSLLAYSIRILKNKNKPAFQSLPEMFRVSTLLRIARFWGSYSLAFESSGLSTQNHKEASWTLRGIIAPEGQGPSENISIVLFVSPPSNLKFNFEWSRPTHCLQGWLTLSHFISVNANCLLPLGLTFLCSLHDNCETLQLFLQLSQTRLPVV